MKSSGRSSCIRSLPPLAPCGRGAGGEGFWNYGIAQCLPKTTSPASCDAIKRKPRRLVWFHLRSRRFGKFKFRRQVSLGDYIVDFVCFDQRLIVELDGGQHTLQRDYDARRTSWLESQGFCVVRFWNHDVLEDWETVAEAIWRALHEGTR
ncbi:MAG: DUF559 domain-containing protein [Pirellulales bacterium]